MLGHLVENRIISGFWIFIHDIELAQKYVHKLTAIYRDFEVIIHLCSFWHSRKLEPLAKSAWLKNKRQKCGQQQCQICIHSSNLCSALLRNFHHHDGISNGHDGGWVSKMMHWFVVSKPNMAELWSKLSYQKKLNNRTFLKKVNLKESSKS